MATPDIEEGDATLPLPDDDGVPDAITEANTTENRFAALEDRLSRLEDVLGICDGVVG